MKHKIEPTFEFKDQGCLIEADLSLQLKETKERNEAIKSVATYHFDICVDNDLAGGI